MGEIHARRRAALLERMGGGVMLLPAAPQRVSTHDLFYPYRPDSALTWATGYLEPEALAVLNPAGPARLTFFVRERDAEAETWWGRRGGPAAAREEFGADEAYPLAELEARLPGLLCNQEVLWYRFGLYDYDRQVRAALEALRAKVRLGQYPPRIVKEPGLLIDELRLRKSDPHDQAALRRACAVTSRGHAAVLAALPGARSEADLQAAFEAAIRSAGASGPAFNSIVGAGVNACVLHYDANRAPLAPGSLVLVDAGAEVDGWCGDITRTYPVGGRYSAPQAELYDLVLAAQRAALAACRPGTTLDAIMAESVRVLADGLVRLGFFDQAPSELIASAGYKRYFMHRVSHWLGMDTHDVGDYHRAGQPRVLEPGMAFTVEPGLYVAPGSPCPARYHGIGIRIEDDVLLTDDGYEQLTSGPTERAEIERALASAACGRSGLHSSMILHSDRQ